MGGAGAPPGTTIGWSDTEAEFTREGEGPDPGQPGWL